jgi:hypothetical protein
VGTMRTIDNNKLIAEFMGYPKKQINKGVARLEENKYVWGQTYYYINGDYHKEDYLLFHLDWNWLMKVVDKIESFEDNNRCAKYNINIEQSFVEIIDKNTDDTIVETDADTKIEATYNAVIEFIKYYNNEN